MLFSNLSKPCIRNLSLKSTHFKLILLSPPKPPNLVSQILSHAKEQEEDRVHFEVFNSPFILAFEYQYMRVLTHEVHSSKATQDF